MRFSAFIKRMAICVMAVFMTSAVNAQTKWEYDAYPHAFVDVQGGVRTITSDLWGMDLMQPSVQLSIGGYVNRILGVRLAVNGAWGESLLDDAYSYKYNLIGGDVDLLFDITDIFRRTDKNRFHFILFGGLGMQNSWNYKYGNVPEQTAYAYSRYLRDNHVSAHARFGAQAKVNLGRVVDLNLEVNAAPFSTRFDRLIMNKDDNPVAAYIGLSFKFGQEKRAVRETAPVATPMGNYNSTNGGDQVATAPKTQAETKPAAKPEPKTEPAPAPVPAEMTQNVFFALASADVADAEMGKVQQIVDFMKQYPTATLTITGYADKGTGNARINQRLSKARAEQVAHEIIKRGIERDRVAVDFKGDTEQPFTENDRNRAVIGKAKEK